jgi:hypothetical protein
MHEALRVVWRVLKRHGHFEEHNPVSAKCSAACHEAFVMIRLLSSVANLCSRLDEEEWLEWKQSCLVTDGLIESFEAGALFAKLWARERERYADVGKRVSEGGRASHEGKSVAWDSIRKAFREECHRDPDASRQEIFKRTARRVNRSTKTVARRCEDLWRPRTPRPDSLQ